MGVFGGNSVPAIVGFYLTRAGGRTLLMLQSHMYLRKWSGELKGKSSYSAMKYIDETACLHSSLQPSRHDRLGLFPASTDSHLYAYPHTVTYSIEDSHADLDSYSDSHADTNA